MAEPTIAHLTAAVVRDGDWYVTRCMEAEVASQDESMEAALANLTEALELYFEDMLLVETPQPIVALSRCASLREPGAAAATWFCRGSGAASSRVRVGEYETQSPQGAPSRRTDGHRAPPS
jgi:predicted RNase H-like HicB family nuclease